MPTKAETKELSKPIKLKVRTGDRVMVIAGKDKGRSGIIIAVSPREKKVIVVSDENPDQQEPLNRIIKHRKPKMQNEPGSRVTLPAPLHISNIKVIDSAGNPTRIGKRLEDGKLVRYSKKSGETLKDDPIMQSRK